MSYAKSDAQLASGSESEEEVIIAPKGKGKKGEGKGKKTPEKKSYRCDRCNFSSSSKAKYTKHAKSAHSGTIVQCDHCEFKTPYKWNLDRHYKNHLGGGILCCHLCNFSCDIKQSLTVHLQNHHSNVPEEIIESVKRQQIPPRNQSINNPLHNNSRLTANSNATSTAESTSGSNAVNNNNKPETVSSPAGSPSEAEKKVPPLRISRSLTGLSLGEENTASNSSNKEEEVATTVAAVAAPIPEVAVAATVSSNDSSDVRKCDLCDYEASGEGGSSLLKKHLASQHGIHHSKKHHHHHHHHKRNAAAAAARSASSSPEPHQNASPSLPIVPIPLPPKKSKGSTSPRPGQSASSTSNSPAIHRSQSPLKASEAINAYGSDNLQAVAPSSSSSAAKEEERHQGSVLSLAQGQLQSSGEESAFTPVLGSDYSQHALSSLKKPKHRALAQFYQKIKPKFNADAIEGSGTSEEIPVVAPVSAIVTDYVKEEEDALKSSTVSSKSNRCQNCRQRCKSSADLAVHLEKCTEAMIVKTEESGESCDHAMKKVEAVENPAWVGGAGTAGPAHGVRAEADEVDEAEYDTKVQMLNGSASEMSDGLIGFETAPGVGAIHTGKLDEIEYQGYLDAEEEGEVGESRTNDQEDEDEEIEEGGSGSGGNGKAGKSGKSAVTSRKVYRCPENDCSFWATTASRFHVHIVGHYNLKPFECSECHYKSNWRWDVNKHIRLKTPKDPKHASAKTLLTHESGQRDYRKYDNYLVSMSLMHNANAKAPDCSTMASKRTKGNTVATPKSSPELQQQSSPGSGAHKDGSPSSGYAVANSPSSNATPAKQRSPKYAKALAASSSSPPTNTPFEQPHEEITAFEYHPSQNHSSSAHQRHHLEQEDHHAHAYPSSADSNGEGRSFVETRMLAGGEIYQQQQQASLLKQDVAGSSPGNHHDGGDESKEGGDDVPPSGFDLTLKRSHSRHAHHAQHQHLSAEEMRGGEDVRLQQQQDMMPVAAAVQSVAATPPTKKSRLKQIQQQQELQQKLEQQQKQQQQLCQEAGGATNEGGNKSLSLWQCIKCSFKHLNKELVSQHIRDVHKPKKGDSVSLLAHNHLIQVSIPEQEVEALMTNSLNMEGMDYSGRMTAVPTISPAQKKEIYQQMFHENGKVLSCKYCPFSTGLLYEMEIHADHHLNKSNSYYSCPHCSYSVAVKSELQEHLRLHGEFLPDSSTNRLINSATNISSSSDRHSMLSPHSTTENLSMKGNDNGAKNRYNCMECPYATNDPSEFQYHKQCHEPHDYPFKCHRCTFNVSVKFHLLQHLRVHGIQIDEVGVPQAQSPVQYPPEPVYEDVSNDYSPPSQIQDEPLNLSIFANRKPVVIWENGVPMEGYKCSVCPQVFHDLNDLKEHEYTNNHRGNANNNNGGAEAVVTYSSSGRQCDSPPCEAMNLSYKPVEMNKKSSQCNSKVNNSGSNKRSVSAAVATLPQQQQQQPQQTLVPMSSPSPSSVHSAELGSSGGSIKGEKEFLFLCDECPARFFFEKELKIHHTFHENKSSFQCPKCSYSARQKDPHLMSHMRVHGTAYQEKTKGLLTKFPRGKANLPSCNSSSSATGPAVTSASASAAAVAAAALSAASLMNPSILNPNFNFQSAAAAMLASGKFKPESMAAFGYPADPAALEGLRKNGLSIACPKCPEKFFSTQAFQQHYEMHNINGRADYRCRFCDYCAESRKALAIHEIVHSGSEFNLEAGALAGKLLTSPGTAFNPVSMMAMVAHQESPFTSPAVPQALTGNSEVENVDKSAIPVPDEAYEGNPDFTYPTYMKNGRVKSKRYKCIKCPSAFEKKDQYHTHIGLHGSNQKYKCTVCDYAVTYYANYIQHLKKHENQRNIPTDLLVMGRKRHHHDDEVNGSAKIAKIAENGENSRSSNDSLESLENHHNGTSNGHSGSLLKCSFCPFQCFDDPTLDSHLVHHQSNPNWLHVCNICTFRTSSKKSLKEHARLHLLNTFQLQQQQQLQQQHAQLAAAHQNIQNGTANNGHHHHPRNGEYVNGYDDHHQHRHPHHDKHNNSHNHRNEYAEHEDSSNGSL